MKHLRFLPFLLILSLIACCIEVDISVPSFPDMAHFFDVSEGMIQLTIAYNFLGFCLAGIFHGPLSECFGRRKVMVIGNALLLMGALGCVFAPSIYWLLAARFIQGIGASTSAVVVFAMIADAYQGDKAVKFIGIMNSVLTALMAIAPVAGGFINQAIGWQGNYATVAIISLVSWVLLLLMLPETKKDFEIFSFKKVMKDYTTLFASLKFMSASMVPSLLCSAYMAFVACGSFLYMETFGLPTIAYALHQGCIVACFSFASFFSDKIIRKFGSRTCIVKCISLCVVSTVTLVVLSLISPNSPYLITLLMSTFAFSFAIVYNIIFAASLEVFPKIKGTASFAIMAIRALLCSAFIGLISYLYNGEPIRVFSVILFIVLLGFMFTLNILKSDQISDAALEVV